MCWKIVFLFTVLWQFSHVNGCRRFPNLEVLQRYYFKRTVLPVTTNDAWKNGWNKVSTVKHYNIDMYRFKHVNNIFIFYYKDYLVGVGPIYKSDTESLVSMSTEEYRQDVRKKGLPRAAMGKLSSKTSNWFHHIKAKGQSHMYKYSIKIDNIRYKYALILFADPNILEMNSEDPCKENQIFFEGRKNGKWYTLPTQEKDIPTELAKMDKQGCLDRFGHYYFYSLKNETKCRKVHGFFSFYDESGDIAGFGTMFMGSDILWEDANHPHPVYLFLNIQQVKDAVPNNKKCFTGKAYEGITAITFFLKPKSETHDFKCSNKERSLII